jgi:hypothetical protein
MLVLCIVYCDASVLACKPTVCAAVTAECGAPVWRVSSDDRKGMFEHSAFHFLSSCFGDSLCVVSGLSGAVFSGFVWVGFN